MNFNENKLNKISEEHNFLGTIRNINYEEQEEQVVNLIKQNNIKISMIRQNPDSYFYIKGTNKRTLTMDAKHEINLLNKELRNLSTYLTHLRNEINKKNQLEKRHQEPLYVEKIITLNDKQNEILNNLLKTGIINTNNMKDVIQVWTYMIDQNMFLQYNKEIYEIIKFVNEIYVNSSVEKRNKYDKKLNELKGIIIRKIKQYPKKSLERRILKYNKKFIKSITKTNQEVSTSNYDRRYDILDYFLNDPNGYVYLQRLFEYDSDLFNLRDRNGCHILNNILKKYVDSYKKELINHEKIIVKKEYYEKLFQLFASKKIYNLNLNDRQLFNSIENEFEEFLKNSKYNRDIVSNALYSLRNITNVNKKENKQKELKQSEIHEIIEQMNNLSLLKKVQMINPKRKIFGDDIYTFMMDSPSGINDIAYSLSYTQNGHILLSVHTPDLEVLIPEDSPLDKVLYNKMFSMNNWRQFFPREILENLDLDVNSLNPCMTYQIELLPNGKIGNSYFFKSNVVITEQISRDDINNGLLNDKLKTFIQTSYMIDEENIYPSLATRLEITYAKLVNNAIGSKFEKNNIPFIYVNQLPQNADKFVEMISNLNYTFYRIPKKDFKDIYKIICDDVNKAYYDIKNQGHNELNFDYKSDILNPLNSYLGIVGQRLVTTFFIEKFYNETYRMNKMLELLKLKDYANEVKEEKINEKRLTNKI